MKSHILGNISRMLIVAMCCTATSIGYAEVPDDGQDAKVKRFDNVSKVRYIEIFLIGERKDGRLVGACYNTTFTSDPIPESKDTSPQKMVEELDFEALKKEYGVVAVGLNGPKRWMVNWWELPIGVERKFNGMAASWCASLVMRDASFKNMESPYEPKKIERKSQLGYNNGTTVFLIDDTDGNTWIM